jgi:DNA-binding LacI/PurR family transcriptional regulator
MDARTNGPTGQATSLRRRPVENPTLADVASLAGVSRATASRVINDIPTVSAATRLRVQRAVAALGYVPDQAAVALARRRGRPTAA